MIAGVNRSCKCYRRKADATRLREFHHGLIGLFLHQDTEADVEDFLVVAVSASEA